MTRFETVNGTQLGVRFCGDDGATFHLTQQETKDLFNLDLDLEVVSDNSWFGTVSELLELFVKGNKCSKEQLKRRFEKEVDETLHFKSRQSLDSNGDLREFFVR